jgi:hypothetical protein
MHRVLTAFALIACCARAADEEARYKPKAYSGKALSDRSYQAAAYQPSAPTRSIGTPAKNSSGGFWSRFKSKGSVEEPRLAGAAAVNAPAYVQEKHISVPTTPPDPSAVPEKKPFDDSGKRVTDATYKAPDKPTEKNPLLKPRQGIKEPE